MFRGFEELDKAYKISPFDSFVRVTMWEWAHQKNQTIDVKAERIYPPKENKNGQHNGKVSNEGPVQSSSKFNSLQELVFSSWRRWRPPVSSSNLPSKMFKD